MRIEASALGKRYGDVVALRELSFEVPAGRRVALLGPNGSGKSTLIRVLIGLLAHEGEVRLAGCSPLRERLAVARRMAYVPQLSPQLAAPVGELVGALVRIRDLERGRLGKLAGELGLDLGGLAARPFRSLSGGTRQKLLIALALAAPATLLLLDEPTGSLDANARERCFDLLSRVAPEVTLLLCSHRLEELRPLVEHVLVLDEGRLVYDGPAEAFLEASTRGALEVRVADPGAQAWLEERGFRRGAAGWWVRSVSPAEKRTLLPELTRRLGGALRDVNVRDFESVELPPRDRDV